ncbi:hypothetical protein LVJ83_08995 [Uruburuella testudinis]|uniref:Large polyvalent protein-associated domain-containing protein n=1 Tax=Uruburuella testudinis TaxID=1282863 RepID=A0ABY4DWP9_9NEIS|nr:hypothetical protein [Uruburuella testudinis]UOO81111.1 hypothetical protein LVJ83_08995 [Uruburuella testudinis]
MNPIEKMKLAGRLKAAVAARNIEKNPLKKLPLLKEVEELRKQLGFKVKVNKLPESGLQPLDVRSLQPLEIPENATAKAISKALMDYLKQMQGKTVETSDGKTVRFSKRSKNHIAYDVAFDDSIVAVAVSHTVDVLMMGNFVGRQLPDEKRNDIAAFHVYRKWVDVSDKQVHMQVKAAELADGLLAADGLDLLVYTVKDYEKDKEKEDSRKLSPDSGAVAYDGVCYQDDVCTKRPLRTPPSLKEHHTAVFDRAQVSAEEYPPLIVEILEIRENNNKAV